MNIHNSMKSNFIKRESRRQRTYHSNKIKLKPYYQDIYIYIYIYAHRYTCIDMYVCVCVCKRERASKRERERENQTCISGAQGALNFFLCESVLKIFNTTRGKTNGCSRYFQLLFSIFTLKNVTNP